MAIQTALNFINANSRIIVTTHDAPDGDGLGSAYALARGLALMGKECAVVLSRPAPEKFSFIDVKGIIRNIADGPLPKEMQSAACVVVDTNDSLNLGSFGDRVLPSVGRRFFIDHHQPLARTPFKGWIDTKAAASAEMVFDILKSLQVRIEPDMAAALLTGIVFDTGSFIYARTSPRTFKTAYELRILGASPSDIHHRLYECSSSAALMLMKAAISSLELRADGRIACMTLGRGDFEASGALYEDAEGLINMPLSAQDVEVSLLIKESPENGLRCSLRSKGKINVATIAQRFGGGGHTTASGFRYDGTVTEAKNKLVALTELLLEPAAAREPRAGRGEKAQKKGDTDT
jgi:phosphoesterase RecJ-like protein